MEKFKGRYRIPSNRWQFWDYSSPGSYFITICIQDRRNILGHIVNGKMQLSERGVIVKQEFLEIPGYHKRIILDEWVIMPNHVHCIITLGDWDYDINASPPPSPMDVKQYRAKRRKMLIPKILGKFQMKTSKQINIVQNTPGQKNWQRDYHDHVIRNYTAFIRIKNYIVKNPENWNTDKWHTT